MKRINPLLTDNNPVPIPGCHVTEGCWAQCCGYLDFTYHHTESPSVMTTEVLDIRSIPLENSLETWLWEDKVLSRKVLEIRPNKHRSFRDARGRPTMSCSPPDWSISSVPKNRSQLRVDKSPLDVCHITCRWSEWVLETVPKEEEKERKQQKRVRKDLPNGTQSIPFL